VRVFLTGATGFLGSGIGRALLAVGHQVRGLARSPAAADALRRAGIEPFPGDLSDAARLAAGAAEADAIIQAGFPRDAYEHLDRAISLDQAAVRAFRQAISGTPKRLIYTSGAGVVGDTGGRAVPEDEPLHTPAGMAWRRELELDVLDAGGIVIRPSFVYGRAGGDILRALIGDAIARGYACYAEPGDNALPVVHIDDLGQGYALALEHAAPGSVFNLAGGETTPAAMIKAIGRLVGTPERTRALPMAAASQLVPYIGWLQGSIRIDSTRARAALGWHPDGPDILDDIEHGSYRQLTEYIGTRYRPHRVP
jgi:nucleoside-diphosphate-sugar epimerase